MPAIIDRFCPPFSALSRNSCLQLVWPWKSSRHGVFQQIPYQVLSERVMCHLNQKLWDRSAVSAFVVDLSVGSEVRCRVDVCIVWHVASIRFVQVLYCCGRHIWHQCFRSLSGLPSPVISSTEFCIVSIPALADWGLFRYLYNPTDYKGFMLTWHRLTSCYPQQLWNQTTSRFCQ